MASVSSVVASLIQLSKDDQRKTIQALLLTWPKEDVENLTKWVLPNMLNPISVVPSPVYAPPMMMSLPAPPSHIANGRVESIWHQPSMAVVKQAPPVPAAMESTTIATTAKATEKESKIVAVAEKPEDAVSICGDWEGCACFHQLTKKEEDADDVPEFEPQDCMLWFDSSYNAFTPKQIHGKAFEVLSPFAEKDRKLVRQIFARKSWITEDGEGDRIPANARIYCRSHEVATKLMAVARKYIAKHPDCGISVSGAYPDPRSQNGETEN